MHLLSKTLYHKCYNFRDNNRNEMLFAHVRNMLLAILNCSAQFKIVRNLRLHNLPCEKQKSYIAFKLFWKNAGKLFLTSFLVDSIQHFAWISSFLCVLQVLSILKFAFKNATKFVEWQKLQGSSVCTTPLFSPFFTSFLLHSNILRNILKYSYWNVSWKASHVCAKRAYKLFQQLRIFVIYWPIDLN